jgi:hypothetical protein
VHVADVISWCITAACSTHFSLVAQLRSVAYSMGASGSREQQSEATMSGEASSCPVVGSSVGSTPPETTATGIGGSSCPIPERYRRGPVYNVYNQRIDGAPAPPSSDMHAALDAETPCA